MLLQHEDINTDNILECFTQYLAQEDLKVSRAEFEKNMHEKLRNNLFLDDIAPLIISGLQYNHYQAYENVHILSKLPGEAGSGI